MKRQAKRKRLKKVVPKKVQKEVEFEYTKLLENIGQDESLLDTIDTLLDKKDSFSLMVGGEDLITHPTAKTLRDFVVLLKNTLILVL